MNIDKTNILRVYFRGQKTLGIDRPDELSKEDDEYEAYRKRMMLAYRFRPNPLVSTRMCGWVGGLSGCIREWMRWTNSVNICSQCKLGDCERFQPVTFNIIRWWPIS